MAPEKIAEKFNLPLSKVLSIHCECLGDVGSLSEIAAWNNLTIDQVKDIVKLSEEDFILNPLSQLLINL